MPQTTIQQAIQIAMRHHRQGQLAAAEGIYRQVFARHPNHAEALHLLGLIAVDVGRIEGGIELVRRAISDRFRSCRLSQQPRQRPRSAGKIR